MVADRILVMAGPPGRIVADLRVAALTRFAQRLEDANFDAFFMADHLAVLNMPVEALSSAAMPGLPSSVWSRP